MSDGPGAVVVGTGFGLFTHVRALRDATRGGVATILNEIAKSADKDCFALLGRTLEWKQLSDASDLKDELTAMVRQFGIAPQYIRDLCGIYRETKRAPGAKRPERPWRFHRRLYRILGSSRSRNFQKARASLIADLVGKNPVNLKLRPSGRVALEWARLSTEGQIESLSEERGLDG